MLCTRAPGTGPSGPRGTVVRPLGGGYGRPPW